MKKTAMPSTGTIMFRSMVSSMLPMTIYVSIALLVLASIYQCVFNCLITNKIPFKLFDWATMLTVIVYSVVILCISPKYSILKFKTVNDLLSNNYKREGYSILDWLVPVLFTGTAISYVFRPSVMVNASLMIIAAFGDVIATITYSLKDEKNWKTTKTYYFLPVFALYSISLLILVYVITYIDKNICVENQIQNETQQFVTNQINEVTTNE